MSKIDLSLLMAVEDESGTTSSQLERESTKMKNVYLRNICEGDSVAFPSIPKDACKLCQVLFDFIGTN